MEKELLFIVLLNYYFYMIHINLDKANSYNKILRFIYL
jgi:hypothetical protein